MNGLRPLAAKAALAIPSIRRLWNERNELARQPAPSPFWHYQSSFDPQEVIRRYSAMATPTPHEDFATNFLGVRIDPAVFPTALEAQRGVVEHVPIPANWHADIAEWGAALRAVDLANGTFRAVELGCGWACWLTNTGIAARIRGLTVDLIGIEGDHGHVAMAEASLTGNGFGANDYRIIHGVAARTTGAALFPVVADPSASWGSEPLFHPSEAQVAEAERTGGYDLLAATTIAELSGGRRVDLLHVDIQGGEVALLGDGAVDLMDAVAYVVIGTHSRTIDGMLLEAMSSKGWILEIERPCIFTVDGVGNTVTSVDGVQGWRNPNL